MDWCEADDLAREVDLVSLPAVLRPQVASAPVTAPDAADGEDAGDQERGPRPQHDVDPSTGQVVRAQRDDEGDDWQIGLLRQPDWF